MNKSVEAKVDICPMEMRNLGDSKKKCLLKDQALCYCKNYKGCGTYKTYKARNKNN